MKADTSLWSKESKQSYAVDCIKEYTDKEYNCWRCKTKSVFTAADQKYTYEVKKAYYWQQRILCHECWKQKNVITRNIQDCEKRWDKSKKTLKMDPTFLEIWLNLLVTREEYVPYKPNTAIKNMLTNLLDNNP